MAEEGSATDAAALLAAYDDVVQRVEQATRVSRSLH
jgi:hypothetical protein